MNYLPFIGHWFYGATSSSEVAVYFDTWGLLSAAPAYTPPVSFGSWMIMEMSLLL